MKRLAVLALRTGWAMAALSGTCGAAPFTNGSFEAASLDPGSFATLGTGNTQIVGWTVDSGNIDYVRALWQASDGARSVDLNGTQAGSLSQSFDTNTGSQYEVSFDLAGNPYVPPTIKQLTVAAANDSSQYLFDVTGLGFNNMGYQPRTFVFTAVGSSTTLTFASGSPDFYGPVIDNVRVTEVSLPVPEPSAWLLMLAGTAVLGIGARWRASPERR